MTPTRRFTGWVWACSLVLAALQPGGSTLVLALDCNQNQVEDDWDISSGTSIDCNSDGVPDECELRGLELGAPRAVAGPPGVVYIATHDADGDGDQDLLAAVPQSNEILVFESDGRGRLNSRVASQDANATRLEPADFDADGHADIAAASFGGGVVYVLYGEAGGGFSTRAALDRIDSPSDVAAVDLDRDGRLDLVAAIRSGCDCAHVILNLGDRKFSAPQPLSVGQNPFDVAAADLNGDGWADVAVAAFNAPGVVSFLNAGATPAGAWGGLSEGKSTALSSHPAAIVPVDADGDRDLDLIAAHSTPDGVSLLLNDGSGAFEDVGLRFATGPEVESVAAGDLNGDQVADLIVADVANGRVIAAPGRGRGSYEVADAQPVDGTPRAVALIDVDLDGKPEAAVANRSVAIFHRLVNGSDCNGNGAADDCDVGTGGSTDCNANRIPDECDVTGRLRFTLEENASVLSARQWSVAASQVDEDPRIDLAFGMDSPGSPHHVQVILNGGPPREVRTVHDARLVRFQDLDGDGRDDLLVAGAGGLSTYTSLGSGFEAPKFQSIGDGRPYRVIADLDGDGDLDTIVGRTTDSGLEPQLNDGKGAFTAGASRRLAVLPQDIAAADFNGDGRTDLAVSLGASHAIWILENDVAGAFPRRATLEAGQSLQAVTAADLDGDGATDLAGADPEAGLVFAFRNDGTGGFGSSIELEATSLSDKLQAADLDGDGRVDLVGLAYNGLDVLQGLGGAAFQNPQFFRGGASLEDFRVLDLDGDADLDILVASHASEAFIVFHNESARPASLDEDLNGVPDECRRPEFHRGDSNLDGKIDVSDGQCLLRFLFEAGAALGCLEASDANNDGLVDCSDAISTLGYLFIGTEPPGQPGPPPNACGPDPDPLGSAHDLGCDRYPLCQ